MSNRNEYDVIVVGGGQGGGLPAATYLQKAGARVVLIEARNEVAAMNITHEYIPGSYNTTCAAACLTGISPAWEDLNLEDYGVRLNLGPMHVGSLFPDGTCLFFYYDLQKNLESIARFSKKDAERFVRIFEGIGRNIGEFDQLMWYSMPTPERLERMWELCGDIWGIPSEDFRDMNVFELIETTFESEHVRQHFLCSAATQVFGDIGEKGHGAFAVPAYLTIFPGQISGGNHALAHACVRIFLEHGGTILRNCPVERIIVEDGVATGVQLSETAANPDKVIHAKHAVISGIGAKLTLDVIGEDVMKKADSVLAYKMKHWDMAGRASAVAVWTLKGFPKWKAVEYDPDIKKAHFYYKMWGSWENVKKWYLASKGNDAWGAFGYYGEIACPGVLDPLQVSPEGHVLIRMEYVLPFDGFRRQGGTPETWDDVKEVMLEKLTDIMEELAPGFKDQVVYSFNLTPLDIWRYDAAAIKGNAVGGSFGRDQWYLSRMPYRMPIKGLYMANGVWPLQFSIMGGGYNAASAVAEDMGIREQPWWTHKPVEWFFKNLERNMVIK